jgi:transcriptional regulator with PAS, ATPase and Fis domain
MPQKPPLRAWFQEFRGSIVVCDPEGIILEMNDAAIRSNAEDGGAKLIGTNLIDCHPEPSLTKLKAFMAKRELNVYTIEKRGVKKLVYQTPWHLNGVYAGFLEVVLEIPFEVPHFVREG